MINIIFQWIYLDTCTWDFPHKVPLADITGNPKGQNDWCSVGYVSIFPLLSVSSASCLLTVYPQGFLCSLLEEFSVPSIVLCFPVHILSLVQVLAHVPCVCILHVSSSIKHFLIIACQMSEDEYPSVSYSLGMKGNPGPLVWKCWCLSEIIGTSLWALCTSSRMCFLSSGSSLGPSSNPWRTFLKLLLWVSTEKHTCWLWNKTKSLMMSTNALMELKYFRFDLTLRLHTNNF